MKNIFKKIGIKLEPITVTITIEKNAVENYMSNPKDFAEKMKHMLGAIETDIYNELDGMIGKR